jgi:hypothetical protein
MPIRSESDLLVAAIVYDSDGEPHVRPPAPPVAHRPGTLGGLPLEKRAGLGNGVGLALGAHDKQVALAMVVGDVDSEPHGVSRGMGNRRTMAREVCAFV